MLRFYYFQFLTRFLFGILIFFIFFSLFRNFSNPNENFQTNQFVLIDRILSPLFTRVEISKHSIINYLREYRTKIEGSVTNELLYAIWILVQFQYRWLNSIGSIGEIGVHQGQLTSFLYLMRRFREQNLFAIESNRKSKQIFLQNILQYADIYENELNIYFGSTLNFNPIFSNSSSQNHWWSQSVIAERGIQLISINGSRSELLTYADLCLISKSLIDGGVVIIDETFPSDLSTIRYGILRFLSETSTFVQDEKLKDDLSQRPNTSFNFDVIRFQHKVLSIESKHILNSLNSDISVKTNET